MEKRQSVIVEARPEVVRGNPYQVRELDEGLVEELAAVIGAQGFRGVLVGRAVPADADVDGGVEMEWSWMTLAYGSPIQQDIQSGRAVVELAWGHHRLEAAKRAGVELVPVEVVWGLADEEMASWALMENVRRRDLSAIEEAQAIRRLVDEFGWTQARVAEALGYASKATVSNKLRLLRLPEEIKEKVQAGELAERQARSLVTLAEVSEAKATELVGDGRELTDRMVREALRGATKGLVGEWDKAPWPMDWVPTPEPGGWVTCEVCKEHLKLGDEVRCKKRRCWRERNRLWEAKMAAEASEIEGIPLLGEGERVVFGWRWTHAGLVEERCKKRDGGICPFLRLAYHRHYGTSPTCGSKEEWERCLEWYEAEEEKEKEAGEERRRKCRAVIETAAEELGREFEGLRAEVVDWLVEHMKWKGSGGWEALPEGWEALPEEWQGEKALGWSIIVRTVSFSPYGVVPLVEEMEGEVERVLREVGLR